MREEYEGYCPYDKKYYDLRSGDEEVLNVRLNKKYRNISACYGLTESFEHMFKSVNLTGYSFQDNILYTGLIYNFHMDVGVEGHYFFLLVIKDHIILFNTYGGLSTEIFYRIHTHERFNYLMNIIMNNQTTIDIFTEMFGLYPIHPIDKYRFGSLDLTSAYHMKDLTNQKIVDYFDNEIAPYFEGRNEMYDINQLKLMINIS